MAAQRETNEGSGSGSGSGSGNGNGNGNGNDSGGNSKSLLEQVFSSIEEGNALTKKQEFWKSAHSFFSAFKLLRQLANGDENDTSSDNEEKDKIRKLYRDQAEEYWKKSRRALIQAMKFECENETSTITTATTTITTPTTTTTHEDESGQPQDKEGKKEDEPNNDKNGSISEEEAQLRLTLFASLFAREEDVLRIAKKDKIDQEDISASVSKQQSSLEERLNALNQSLPSGFKTSEERMRDINRGLNRLGLSLHTNTGSSNKMNLLNMPNIKSEVEQVDDIIAQAKDEVLMSHQHPVSDATTVSGSNSGVSVGRTSRGPSTEDLFLDDAGDSDLESDNDDDDDGLELSKEDLKCIQEKVNAAQSSLAQLSALLAAATEADANKQVGQETELGIKQNDVDFDHNMAKKALRDTHVLLQQATKRWRDKTEA